MKQLMVLIFLFLLIMKVPAGIGRTPGFQKASIPVIIEQLKFLNINISRKDDLQIEWRNLALHLEQTPVFPKKYRLLLKNFRDHAVKSLKPSSKFRSKLLASLDKHVKGVLPDNHKFIIKFSDENVLQTFLAQFPRAKRLHSKLLWIVFSASQKSRKINTFDGYFVRIEKLIVNIPFLIRKGI